MFSLQEREFTPVDFSNAEQDYTDIAMAHVLQGEGKWLTAVSTSHSKLWGVSWTEIVRNMSWTEIAASDTNNC